MIFGIWECRDFNTAWQTPLLLAGVTGRNPVATLRRGAPSEFVFIVGNGKFGLGNEVCLPATRRTAIRLMTSTEAELKIGSKSCKRQS